MTTSPMEPGTDPEIVPSGDPAPDPIAPGEPLPPTTEPEPVP